MTPIAVLMITAPVMCLSDTPRLTFYNRDCYTFYIKYAPLFV